MGVGKLKGNMKKVAEWRGTKIHKENCREGSYESKSFNELVGEV